MKNVICKSVTRGTQLPFLSSNNKIVFDKKPSRGVLVLKVTAGHVR